MDLGPTYSSAFPLWTKSIASVQTHLCCLCLAFVNCVLPCVQIESCLLPHIPLRLILQMSFVTRSAHLTSYPLNVVERCTNVSVAVNYTSVCYDRICVCTNAPRFTQIDVASYLCMHHQRGSWYTTCDTLTHIYWCATNWKFTIAFRWVAKPSMSDCTTIFELCR